MLFFRKHDSDIDIPFEMKNWINRQSKRRNKVFCEFPKKIIVTLQVRLPENMTARSGKRVSFSASASMTVEAALVLPLFICRVYPDAAISNLKYPETGAGDSGGGC